VARVRQEGRIQLLAQDAPRRPRKVFDPAEGSSYLASEDESLVMCPGGELWVDGDAFERAAEADG